MKPIRKYGGYAYDPEARAAREGSAIRRAQREMGYMGGDGNPLGNFLREKGMTERDFFDAVYDRAEDFMAPRIVGRVMPEEIDSDYERPGLMYKNGGSFTKDALRRALRKARREARRKELDRDPVQILFEETQRKEGIDKILRELGNYGSQYRGK